MSPRKVDLRQWSKSNNEFTHFATLTYDDAAILLPRKLDIKFEVIANMPMESQFVTLECLPGKGKNLMKLGTYLSDNKRCGKAELTTGAVYIFAASENRVTAYVIGGGEARGSKRHKDATSDAPREAKEARVAKPSSGSHSSSGTSSHAATSTSTSSRHHGSEPLKEAAAMGRRIAWPQPGRSATADGAARPLPAWAKVKPIEKPSLLSASSEAVASAAGASPEPPRLPHALKPLPAAMLAAAVSEAAAAAVPSPRRRRTWEPAAPSQQTERTALSSAPAAPPPLPSAAAVPSAGSPHAVAGTAAPAGARSDTAPGWCASLPVRTAAPAAAAPAMRAFVHSTGASLVRRLEVLDQKGCHLCTIDLQSPGKDRTQGGDCPEYASRAAPRSRGMAAAPSLLTSHPLSLISQL